jgi:hypothetical protein
MPDPELPEVGAGSEEGFADLTLRLDRLYSDEEGATHLQASGMHRGQLVGFAVMLGSQWVQQPLENSLESIYWGEVTIESVGDASDSFLGALDEIYSTRLSPARMRGETRFLAAGLGENPHELLKTKTHIKLFFEHENEERCAEVYLNIDRPNQLVEFHEKDTDYRIPLVRCLSAEQSHLNA